jgi:DnaJ-domain-containing protein 1
MIRFVIIIIFIIACYYMFRYLTRAFKQETDQRSERGANEHQNWQYAHTEEGYRAILGVTAGDDQAAIRKKYKELLAKYHPDKVQHLGIEFQEMAERKTKVIMEAYEFFQKQHNL